MISFLKFLFGLWVIIAIGVVSIKTQFLPGSLLSAEHRLQQNSEDALSALEAPWASVRLDGQKAVLTGEAPNAAAMAEAATVIARAKWRGGLVLGGVTAVDLSAVSIYDGPPVVAPYRWNAKRKDNGIVLSGHAPSEAAREAVFQFAANRFPNSTISGELKIAGGAPPEDEWLKAVSVGLQALTRLERGAVSIEDNHMTTRGVASDQARMTLIRQLMSSMPAGFSGAANVTLAAPPPQSELLSSSEAPSAIREACVRQFRALISGQHITFAYARNTLGPISRAYLSDIADLLSECPEIVLELSGHSDSTGGQSRNIQLSLQRAEAAARYLRSIGVNGAQIRTRGIGAREPLFSNATAEGRAKNRRIEFDIDDEPPQQ